MKKKIIIIFILAMAGIVYGQEQKQSSQLTSKTISKTESGHTFVLKVSKKAFNSAHHDITRVKENIIDNSPVRGIDWSLPQEEFSEFSLTIDGLQISIPPSIYKNFYNPSFGYDNRKNIDAFWGNNYKSVFVYMNGSDGAGAYCVTWTLNKNGLHTFSLIPTYEMYFNFMDD